MAIDEKCPIGCIFMGCALYETNDCISCGWCLADTEEELIIAQQKMSRYLKLSPQEKEGFLQKGAYLS